MDKKPMTAGEIAGRWIGRRSRTGGSRGTIYDDVDRLAISRRDEFLEQRACLRYDVGIVKSISKWVG